MDLLHKHNTVVGYVTEAIRKANQAKENADKGCVTYVRDTTPPSENGAADLKNSEGERTTVKQERREGKCRNN